jgi:hypothetical protein
MTMLAAYLDLLLTYTTRSTTETIKIDKYTERSIPRDGDCLPHVSTTGLESPKTTKAVQTTVSTKMFAVNDRITNNEPKCILLVQLKSNKIYST